MALAAALVVAAPLAGRADPASRGDHPPVPGAPPATEGRSGSPHTAGLRVVSVPLADPSVADVLAPGDLVDLVGTAAGVLDPLPSDAPGASTSPTGTRPGIEIVARAARVREVPLGRAGSRSILVEVPEVEAALLAATAAVTPLAVVVHG